jgi:CHASE3 domain sensor protein
MKVKEILKKIGRIFLAPVALFIGLVGLFLVDLSGEE